ncbi:MAG: hypothetical protein HON55_05360 [Legionellales bacterium]|jgi:hypothetical protein|nr:hypothetical protein [Legionellales bacterium]
MSKIVATIIATAVFLFSSQIYASEYDCQKTFELTQTCTKCKTEKNCTSYHSLNCPKIKDYQSKCTKYITDKITEQQNKAPEDQQNKKQTNEAYPMQKNKGLQGSNLNSLIPDQPIPAPSMKNETPKKSKGLSPPQNDFIMKSWY